MARILGIGIATLDIVNLVDHYPVEDEKMRACGQQIRRGGNVTNSLVVLSQLGHDCSWAGVLAADANSAPVIADLNAHGIDLSRCRQVAGAITPVSYITLSRSSGSRTIVHYRDLPEFGFEDFGGVDTGGFDWIHFEGRNVADTERMLAALIEHGCPRQRLSVEVEKARDGIEALFAHPGTLFLSRAYARAKGFRQAESVLDWARREAPDADLVCAWGDRGAWHQRGAERIHVPATVPAQLLDTIGAGDTFNAGVIDARLRGLDWPAALAHANDLAARKCGQYGFSGLAP